MLTVYLDQNKWIDLAKAIYRGDAKATERDNAETLKCAVDAGRVRFPVSEVHLMEAYRIGNRERRLQLASVFAAFSGGWFVAGRQTRVSHELDGALRMLLTIERKDAQREFDAFARNFFWAFGDNSHLSSLTSIPADDLSTISSTIGPLNVLLSFVALNDEDIRRAAVVQMQSSTLDLTERIRARRALTKGETAATRFRAYWGLLFLEVQDKIDVALRQMGKSFHDLRQLPDEKIMSLIDLVPCWDIERRLSVEVEQQWDREIEGNDVYDIAALTAAIPYCDVIVTEKLWAHLCNACGIAQRYNSRVISSISEIVPLLKQAAS
jgi:hypothetical protein